ncbi:Starch-binding associating with outer membrane [Pedobacter sp. ok626]|uniref:SusD/RagB family nutrient-binding outer membrane lipoprotein n=1 Tax=Pedobacter sp. ok626 TaxID=1761882 RepID=UPI000882E62F|nr:SusD/RagB family nutrient-binding outer membrane lipoprotein [Pedobacter sp. ok626]SDL92926.1 Starch-binding associating with outer membrane [Pedobacter sp. ok626]
MKNLFNICVIAACLFTVSCKKDLVELNTNPNNAKETHPQLLLTKIEWTAFQEFGGTGPLYANKMLVQSDGENLEQYYKWNRSNFDAFNNLRNVVKMDEEATKLKLTSYNALAKFFRAYYFYNLTLTFGDIPYSQALKAENISPIYTPAYDTQKEVFKGILAELSDANNLLKNDNSEILGDIIFGKSTQKWRKAINALRLKVLLTLSKRTGETDLNIINQFASIYASEPLFAKDESAKLVFLNQINNRYPEFNSSGFGSGMYMDMTFVERLKDREDPRLFLFCTQTRLGKEAGKAISDFSSYEGGDPAAPYAETNVKAVAGRVSKVNERYHKDPVNEPRILIGYAEQELILAEAAVKNWITADAKQLYENGVKANFKFYENSVALLASSASLAPYVNENAAEIYLTKPLNNFSLALSTEQKIELITTQKYFQTYFQGGWTAFFSNLRTGYPTYRRPAGVNIPFRWIYPQSEYNNNKDEVNKAITRQFGVNNDLINQPTWWIK